MAKNFLAPENSLAANFAVANEARRRFFRELSIIGTFFVVTVTISSLAYGIFGFSLLPVFKVTFEAFRTWCHFVLYVLVFSWLTYFLEWAWYGLVWLFSLFFHVIPWRPRIIIPGLVTDVALVSLAFTRVFQSADLIVPRPVRAAAEGNMTTELWNEIQFAEGPFWGQIHRFVDRVNAGIWNTIDAIQHTLTYPIRNYPKCCIFIRRVLISLAGSVLLWGFIRLIGYL